MSLVLVILWASLGLHCERASLLEPEPLSQPTLTSLQTNIFTSSCALSGCHHGSSALLGLDLSSGQSYANLVNVRSREAPDFLLVQPGQPENSYLIHKLEGNEEMAPGTLQMPVGREPLSEEKIAAVRDWIAAGAPND